MKTNDFYEVDGCMDFIPVTIDGLYDDKVLVTVSDEKRVYKLVVEEVYRFPKVHEPQKVVVPKFVAEWIEEARAEEYSLYGALEMVKEGNEIFWWLFHDTNQDTFAKAWIFGYEIEQEKLYTVEIPNPESDSLTVLEKLDDGTVIISQMDDFPVDWRNHAEYQLTEQEIRKNFEWAWQFAKPVEDN